MRDAAHEELHQWLTQRSQQARHKFAEQMRVIDTSYPGMTPQLFEIHIEKSLQAIAETVGTFTTEAFGKAVSLSGSMSAHDLVNAEIIRILNDFLSQVPDILRWVDPTTMAVRHDGRSQGMEERIARIWLDLSRTSQRAKLCFNLRDSVRAKAPERRGRTPGSGSYQKADAPLIKEMKRMIDSAEAKSVNDAAWCVASRAKGSGTVESKQARLARGFRRIYGQSQN